MIDKDKNYVGKIIKVNFSYNGHQKDETGIVLKQSNTPNKFGFSLITLDGNTRELYDSGPIRFNSISSVRLEKDVREALVGLYQAMNAQAVFLSNFWKTKNELEANVHKAQSNLKSKTGLMDFSEFGREAERLFSERFPTSNAFQKRLYFSLDFAGSKDFGIAHCQEVRKYASPEQYPFLYREYDNTIQIDYNSSALKTFCEQNAPKEIPELKGKVKSTVGASIGDKNTLSVSRVYQFPLKHGMSRKTLDFLEDTYLAPNKSKPSLNAVIESAKSRQSKASSKSVFKKKDKELE